MFISKRKGLSDHQQGPDLTPFFFYFLEKKNKLDQSRGEGLYPKDLTTITMRGSRLENHTFSFTFRKNRLD